LRLALAGAALLLAAPAFATADVLQGHWEGAFARNGSIQTVALDFASDRAGTFDIPELGCYGEPLDSVSATDSSATFRLLYGTFRMRLHPADRQMTGENRDWGPPVSLHVKRTPRIAVYDTTAISVTRAGATIRATLYLPRARRRVPAVVVAGGSIQTTRARWEYRSWGPVLADRGIAVVVYDRRGHGASTGDTTDTDLKTEAQDVLALVERVRAQSAIDPERVGVMGLSRGGWVASWAAAHSPHVGFLALECGPAVSATEQEMERVTHAPLEDSLTTQDVERAAAYTRLTLDAALGKSAWADVERASAEARSARWKDLVQIPDRPSDLDWWRRNEYDQAAVLRRVRVPVYAAFGAKDVLVPPEENLEPMRRALTQGGNTRVRMDLFPNVGHGLYAYGRLEGDAWKWPRAFWVWSAKAPGAFESVGDWILAL